MRRNQSRSHGHQQFLLRQLEGCLTTLLRLCEDCMIALSRLQEACLVSIVARGLTFMLLGFANQVQEVYSTKTIQMLDVCSTTIMVKACQSLGCQSLAYILLSLVHQLWEVCSMATIEMGRRRFARLLCLGSRRFTQLLCRYSKRFAQMLTSVASACVNLCYMLCS